MKTGLLSIALLLVLQHFTAAQAYRSLLREGSFWDVIWYQSGPLCPRSNVNRTYFGGDTVINQLTYKKLMWQGSISVAPHPASQIERCLPHAILPTINTSMTSFFREDSLSKKVWIWHRDETTPNSTFKEDLLFDFSLEVGDTLKSDYHLNNNGAFLVVDSIQYEPYPWDPSQTTKTYYMTPTTGPSFLMTDPRIFEGFGSGVFLGRMGLQTGPGVGVYLHCYKHSPTSAATAHCSQFLSTEKVQLLELNIYPNPTSAYLYIEGIKEGYHATIRIQDIQGKILINGPMPVDYKIDISALQQGLYFLLVETNGKLNTTKILKQ